MHSIEARLRRELRKYAVELRRLAYSLPKGIGEHELLRLSERMSAAADAAHVDKLVPENTAPQDRIDPEVSEGEPASEAN